MRMSIESERGLLMVLIQMEQNRTALRRTLHE